MRKNRRFVVLLLFPLLVAFFLSVGFVPTTKAVILDTATFPESDPTYYNNETLVASNSVTNAVGGLSIDQDMSSEANSKVLAFGESFMCEDSLLLTHAIFVMNEFHQPAYSTYGIFYARLYNDSSPFGGENYDFPVGSALAVSDPVEAGGLVASEDFCFANFTFSTPYLMTNGNAYVIVVGFVAPPSSMDTANSYLTVANGGSYAGGDCIYWSDVPHYFDSLYDDGDFVFYVYGVVDSSPTPTPSPSPVPSSTVTTMTVVLGEADWVLFLEVVMLVACFVTMGWFNRVPLFGYLVGFFAFVVGIYVLIGGLWASSLAIGFFGVFVGVVGGLTMLFAGLGVRVRGKR